MFFTRCDVERGKMGGCEIYFTKKKRSNLDEPEIDSFPEIALQSVNQVYPRMNKLFISFLTCRVDKVARISGWRFMTRRRKKWGEPSNLGNKINTAQDEMFPSITSDGTLYLHPKVIPEWVALDIFFQSKRKRLGTTCQSSLPCQHFRGWFCIHRGWTTGDKVFSSNREGGKGVTIFTWHLPPLSSLYQDVYLMQIRKRILKAQVLNCFGSDGTSIPFKTDATGTYKFDLKPETTYKLSATNKNYLNKYLEVSTIGLEQSKDFIGDFDFALRSMLRSIELPDIYYDLAKWDLRPESKKLWMDL